MVIKITLSIFGDDLWSEIILNTISGNYIVESSFNPDDKKFENSEETYGYGGISFWHPHKFAILDSLVSYESWFISFLNYNHEVFKSNNIEEVVLFTEIYHSSDNCNFEIFNKESLRDLAKIGVSLPVSVYSINENELSAWENEIELEWVG